MRGEKRAAMLKLPDENKWTLLIQSKGTGLLVGFSCLASLFIAYLLIRFFLFQGS